MGDYKRAEVKELAWHNRRLLGRDEDSHVLVALLPDDAQKRFCEPRGCTTVCKVLVCLVKN
jgi:hypothetical protein